MSYVLVAESRGERGSGRKRHREVVYVTVDKQMAELDARRLSNKSKRLYVMTYEQVRQVAPDELDTYEATLRN